MQADWALCMRTDDSGHLKLWSFADVLAASISLVALILLTSSFIVSCGKDQRVQASVAAWSTFLQAIRDGNEGLAASMLTADSKKYFQFEPEFQESYRNWDFRVIKTETQTDFVRLEILADRQGHQTALFEYVVLEGGQYLLQYPFLIFARDWPVKQGLHFVLHAPPTPGAVFNDSNEDSMMSVVKDLDNFYMHLDSLIGVNFSGKIDYYFCRNVEEAGLLAGVTQVSWMTHAGCIISTQKRDFQDMLAALGPYRNRPIDLLYVGLRGYAEITRIKTEHESPQRTNDLILKYIAKFGEHPVESLAMQIELNKDPEMERAKFWVGGALIDLLLAKSGAQTFARLYASAQSAEILQEQLRTLYNQDMHSLEAELRAKYRPENGETSN
jgi:hypothetical protein